MTVSDLKREASEALQRLTVGIDLLNLMLIDRVLMQQKTGAAIWDTVRDATVLRDPGELEEAWADVETYAATLTQLAGHVSVALPAASLPGIEEESDPWLDYVRAVEALREALGDTARHSSLPEAQEKLNAARHSLNSPGARRDALAALEMRMRAAFQV